MPSKKKVWFPYAVVIAGIFLCIVTTVLYEKRDDSPHTSEAVYGVLAEVIEVREESFVVVITGSDMIFKKGETVVIKEYGDVWEKGEFEAGDKIAITYHTFQKSEDVYEITPGQIDREE